MTVPPEVAVDELIGSGYPCIAYGHTIISHGLARECDAVLRPLQSWGFVHLHFESGTFVLFHLEHHVRTFCRDPIGARESAFRQDKVGRKNTHFIGAYALLAHFLPVGIAHQ